MTTTPWWPAATIEMLRRRAQVIAAVRTFFTDRGVLEVETPLLSRGTVTDLHLHSLCTRALLPGDDSPRVLYLQTSPEFAMKRLLAAGSGSIFQICKAFRDEESGRLHNPEFTMLEWYRPGWDHHQLMDEIDLLLGAVLGVPAAVRRTYGDVMAELAEVDAYRDTAEELRRRALELGMSDIPELDREGWLSLLMSHKVEPMLGRGRPTFVVDYPADQAALARVRDGDPPVAERFEVFVDGLELANGYHELTDAVEQRRRLEADSEERRRRGLPVPPADERLLAALEHGIPECAGVALGIDRLVMLATGVRRLSEVLVFPVDRA